jgi:polygalacturonase
MILCVVATAQAQQRNNPPGSPVSLKSYVCDDGKPVAGDGKHDDTTGIQAAMNDASKTIVIPPGVYRITSTLKMSGNRALVLSAEPGAVFQFRPIDGSTTCIELTTVGD